MKRLSAWAGSVGLTWAAYHGLSDAGRVSTRALDGTLATAVAGTCLLCVTAMLGGTRRWTALGLGLLSFFTATGLIYLRVASALLRHPVLDGRDALELIRSLYLVGCALLLYGAPVWLWRNRRSFLRWRHRKGHRAEELFDL